ncbi:MAG: GNAT family N-acetyltransferase, partial [Campylobacteraceae bacterium]|nr:GNAT family N-acetyltransferase [Campylobacteraceae bacterium]
KRLLDEGRALGLKQIFTLTYEKKFFEKLSFKEIPKESLPLSKIWADCIKCKHFPICDEIALIINI